VFSRNDPRGEQLQSLPLFSACSKRELDAVGRLADETRLRAGTILTRQGSPGHECFVLLDGRADVRIGRKVVAHIGPGEIVGEMALLESEPRTATVVTTTPVRALVMTRPNFTAALEQAPNLARRVMRTLAHRLREVQSAA
jgi:CRP/FNR family transcriptional regulator, cyclic AMP receptor protein